MTSPSDYRPCPRCGIVRIVKSGRDSLCVDCCKAPEPSPRAPQAERLAGYSVRRAERLACLVRDEGRDSIAAFLGRLDLQAIYGLVVALAAMVPVDRSTDELLAWVRDHEEAAA